jgi:glutathione S-transferase
LISAANKGAQNMSDTILYYSPSTASLVVHWLLIELHIPHVLERVDLSTGAQKAPDYLRLNPLGVVPTLIYQGAALNESAAICMHLADAFPSAGLAPALGSIDRANYYYWLCFCANTLQPAYRNWFYPNEAAGEENSSAVKRAAQAKLEAAWAIVERHLAKNGPYLLGAKRSAGDFMLTMLMRWSRNMPLPADSSPANAQFAKAMKALPSFQETYRREGINDWI